MEGNLRFKIDWASLVGGSKFTVFALFYFVFEGNLRGDLTEGFLCYQFGGLIFGGAYICRGLFSQFYGTSEQKKIEFKPRMKLNHDITYIFLRLVYGNV